MEIMGAMKMALDALEWNYNTDLDNIPACEQWAKMLKKTITALRQAIEQAEKQEPVTWRDMAYANLGAVRDKMPPEQVTAVQDWLEKVYTTPPQRKPLTDEEIETIANDFEEGYVFLYRSFARAIEAAHGIGEKA